MRAPVTDRRPIHRRTDFHPPGPSADRSRGPPIDARGSGDAERVLGCGVLRSGAARQGDPLRRACPRASAGCWGASRSRRCRRVDDPRPSRAARTHDRRRRVADARPASARPEPWIGGPMSTDEGRALVATARYGIPQPPSAHVPRPHLFRALAGSADVPLVLVSAPAGAGKTDAVADWARAEPGGAVCWVAFEDGDTSFWEPVLESLREHGLGRAGELDRPGVRWAGQPAAERPGRAGRRRSQRLTLVVDGYELASRGAGARGGPPAPPHAGTALRRPRRTRRPGPAALPVPAHRLDPGGPGARPRLLRRRGRAPAEVDGRRARRR